MLYAFEVIDDSHSTVRACKSCVVSPTSAGYRLRKRPRTDGWPEYTAQLGACCYRLEPYNKAAAFLKLGALPVQPIRVCAVDRREIEGIQIAELVLILKYVVAVAVRIRTLRIVYFSNRRVLVLEYQ